LFGPLPWGQFGPFSFQLCRPVHYAVCFFTGIVIGASGVEREFSGAHGWLARHWRSATVAGIACFGLWLAASVVPMTNPSAPLALKAADAAAYVLACFASCWCALALAARFAGSRGTVWNSLRDNAYGIYLVHYLFAVWLQFALLGTDVTALAKFPLVFGAMLALSWGTAAILRRVPGFALVIGTGWRARPRFPSLIDRALPLAE
jgi:hypothetical protein